MVVRREFGGVLYVWRAVRARAGEGRAPGARARGEGERAVTSLRPQVLHHFFFERWEHPSAWFEHRLAYSRSLGSSTIVGFLLGLGDRHCSNILLDQRSAELVHIDLGIAFDKGQLLKTPERVPFRLTRDVVDGLGVTGVEGACATANELPRPPMCRLPPRNSATLHAAAQAFCAALLNRRCACCEQTRRLC
ncbi:MAG: hypothetical protein CBD47_03900 [Synechococcus sp. TMED187]|nr:MAG: hypothetical protein CBD47_03900 [Synechococcus sp. TMED187]